MTVFEKLPALKERAYEEIRRLILSGEYQGGFALSIRELAEQFGVSKTPVREALLRLEQEGLVETLPYKGTYVKAISQDEIAEVFEVRAALEGLAARLATATVPEEELQEFEEVFCALDDEVSGGEFARCVENDTRFHEMIVEHCGNATLQDFIRQLSDRIYRIRAYSQQVSGDHMRRSHEEHRLVLRALVDRDTARAEELMTRHVVDAAKRIACLADRGTSLE